jgi:ABC-type Fe3+ transport system substrate-binding protein
MRNGLTLPIVVALAIGPLLAAGCSVEEEIPDAEAARAVRRQIRRKWGRPLDELPTVTLVAISPHNENIENEYAWAFCLHHALRHGQKARIEWRSVGGGGSAIRKYLLNVYSDSDRCGIDIVWGGGEFNFQALVKAGVLEELRFPDALRKELFADGNVPPVLGGLAQYDPQLRWIGTAVSGFGFLYNKGMLLKCGIAPPGNWADLGDPRFADLLSLADPTQSGSAAGAYQMIVQSADTWPQGWSKLLRILSNAKRFAESAGSAANAPMLGEALMATCIDFYGTNRAAEAPDQLTYVSPPGETAFGPDPIGILKNPPNRLLAQRFVNFVMSRRGQALWALPPGEADGPLRSPLGRQPIRKDTYHACRGRMLPGIVNPYSSGRALTLDPRKKQVNFVLLQTLIAAAAVDNRDGLRAARSKLIQTGFEPVRLAEFSRLPDNVATLEAMAETARRMKDETHRDRVVTGWQDFFRRKYGKVAR